MDNSLFVKYLNEWVSKLPKIHVVPNLGKWNVFISGKSRVSRVFDTEQKAIEYAKIRAKKMKSDIYIHNEDATINRAIRFTA